LDNAISKELKSQLTKIAFKFMPTSAFSTSFPENVLNFQIFFVSNFFNAKNYI